jgi:hypothetical protein
LIGNYHGYDKYPVDMLYNTFIRTAYNVARHGRTKDRRGKGNKTNHYCHHYRRQEPRLSKNYFKIFQVQKIDGCFNVKNIIFRLKRINKHQQKGETIYKGNYDHQGSRS